MLCSYSPTVLFPWGFFSRPQMLYKFLQHNKTLCCSFIFFSKYRASSCIRHQSWHPSMGCSVHCKLCKMQFLRCRYFYIATFSMMDFLSSPGTFLFLSLGLKLGTFINNFRKLCSMVQSCLLTDSKWTPPDLKYWLFNLEEPLGRALLSFCVVIILQNATVVFGLFKGNCKPFRYCSRTACCQQPLPEIDWSIMRSLFARYITKEWQWL